MDGDCGVVYIIDRVAVVDGGAGLVAVCGLGGVAVRHPAQLVGPCLDIQATVVSICVTDERIGVEHQMVVGEQVGLKLARVPCALRLIIPVFIEEGGAFAFMRLLGAHDVVDRSIDHNGPSLGNNGRLEQMLLGLLVRQQLLAAACNIVHQHIQGGVLGVVVESVGGSGGKDGGGGAVLSVILGGIPSVAVEAGGAVFGVGDQVVVVVLIEFDGLIPVHRVEQADGVGTPILLDCMACNSGGVGTAGRCKSTQGQKRGRDRPGQCLLAVLIR